MNHTTSIVGILMTFGIPLAAILTSTAGVYAQRLSSLPSDSSLSTTTISAKAKAEMCDPSNPSLKVVNTTESHICNIPKTVKNTTTTAAATPAVSSSTTQTTNSSSLTTPKQQQIATTNNNNPASASNSAAAQRVAPVSNVSNKSLSLTSTIAPQANAINQQQQQQQQQPQLLVTVSNGTAGQNSSMLASPPPVVASDKLMYLGYHDGSTDNDLTGKSTMSTKSASNHGSSSSTTDNDSKDKRSSDTKSRSNHNDASKSGSKTASQANNHVHYDSNGSDKANKSSPKGHSNDKRGDSFFGGDPFFSDSDDYG